jgi:hypothetical protein
VNVFLELHVIAVPHVLKECWASKIEWPLVKHSRDKKISKGCF